MREEKLIISYQTFQSSEELTEQDAMLLLKAREHTALAYAPYSKFYVSAVALMDNGEIITGTNQENASYPVGICAERVLLGTIANIFPDESINTIAISYNSAGVKSDHPISPCGMCRQALSEYEGRIKQPIRLLLAGQTGEVIIINSASLLLPLAFTSSELNRHT
jgi:cytidine deaminase